jgi:hypothetical protein
MIGFFRRLRKLFLADGKFRQYMFYALGEILLVVLGILIAIQINSWYSYKADRKQERIYLEQYKGDLETNLNELDRVIKKQQAVIESGDLLYKVHKGSAAVQPFDSLQYNILQMANYTLFMSEEGTVNDILGSGHLSLIQNDSLRKSIVGWQHRFTRVREWEQLGKGNATEVRNLFVLKTRLYEDVYGETFMDSLEIKSMINNPYFLNLAAGKVNSSVVLTELYQEIQEDHLKLLAFLKQELE